MKIDSGLLAYKGENSDVLSKRNGEAKNKIIFNTLSTPRGGEYQLILPDGSRVWLNAASSIRFPTVFTGKERAVEITGEARSDEHTSELQSLMRRSYADFCLNTKKQSTDRTNKMIPTE